ncbi:LCP family protein [Alkaliphilus peptidifermentans]|uniref:Transcriptional attenuator, LytR family n=1 Tax=Alkaliphilus peptidifermentans DSM 18978 TaxID=1120976 RepID=A0A1G5HZ81_9FIRM|nr:LCP family protein [Alkaliphilus peptidifermentans]SCY69001.1 transcriptional attenuator, LytR family [Alkaliphilus peptidifermentans DSM 18978]
MKEQILKFIAFVIACITLAFLSGLISFMVVSDGGNNTDTIKKDTIKNAQEQVKNTSVKIEEDDSRIDFIVAGIDRGKNDALIFATYSMKNHKLDLIFIPRDTYYRFRGGTGVNIDKIKDTHSSLKMEGLKLAMNDIIGRETIEHHIIIDYKAFENLIDSIGGVNVTIKEKMYYNDPYQNPPLVIDFKPGTYNLNGRDSLKYIRYVKGNNSEALNRGSDVGRINAMQSFLNDALEKAFTHRLPVVLTTAFKHINTSFTAPDIVKISTSVAGIKAEDINIYVLPGYMTPENYYVIDQEELDLLISKIYGLSENND